MLKPAVERHLADEPANLANSAKLMVTGADYFQYSISSSSSSSVIMGEGRASLPYVGIHRQLTVEMDAKITKGLHRTDHCRASDQTYNIYGVSQKTSPTFLAVTLESIVGFSYCLAHMLLRK